jgi:hypothetical protein
MNHTSPILNYIYSTSGLSGRKYYIWHSFMNSKRLKSKCHRQLNKHINGSFCSKLCMIYRYLSFSKRTCSICMSSSGFKVWDALTYGWSTFYVNSIVNTDTLITYTNANSSSLTSTDLIWIFKWANKYVIQTLNIWADTVWKSWDAVTMSNWGRLFKWWTDYWWDLTSTADATTNKLCANWVCDWAWVSTWNASMNTGWIKDWSTSNQWPCKSSFHVMWWSQSASVNSWEFPKIYEMINNTSAWWVAYEELIRDKLKMPSVWSRWETSWNYNAWTHSIYWLNWRYTMSPSNWLSTFPSDYSIINLTSINVWYPVRCAKD